MIVWKSLTEYLRERLSESKSINIKGFGAFTFDIETDLPRIATKTINPFSDINEQRAERKHVHKIRFAPPRVLFLNTIKCKFAGPASL